MKTVVYRPAALRDLRALDPGVARQVVAAVDRYAAIDHGNVKRLRSPDTGFRLRVGDWRVRFDFEATGGIRILRVQHRSVAYR